PATLMVPPESLMLLLARLAAPVLKVVEVTATFAVSPPVKSLEYVVSGWMPLVAEYVAKSVPMPALASAIAHGKMPLINCPAGLVVNEKFVAPAVGEATATCP